MILLWLTGKYRKMYTFVYLYSWLIDYLRFYVPLKNISLIWRRHHCRWRTAKFRPMLGAQGLWAGRDLYRATPAVTRDLSFSGLIRRTAPFSRLLPGSSRIVDSSCKIAITSHAFCCIHFKTADATSPGTRYHMLIWSL
jgi:hypothetical protein